MKKRIITALFLALAILMVTGGNAKAVEKNGIYCDSPRQIVIQMRTVPTAGFDMMKLTAVPDFTLYGDGRVIYTRVNENRDVVLMESKLTPDEIGQMLSFMDREGFKNLNDNYMTLDLPDLDATYITVKTRNYERSIRVYGIRLAAHQGLLPRGLVNIYIALSKFASNSAECPYMPERITLFVAPNTGDLPDKPNIVNWKVSGIDLAKFVLTEPSMTEQYKGTPLAGKDKDNVICFLNCQTLYQNRIGFIQTFYRQGKLLYKVGYRPCLPYE